MTSSSWTRTGRSTPGPGCGSHALHFSNSSSISTVRWNLGGEQIREGITLGELQRKKITSYFVLKLCTSIFLCWRFFFIFSRFSLVEIALLVTSKGVSSKKILGGQVLNKCCHHGSPGGAFLKKIPIYWGGSCPPAPPPPDTPLVTSDGRLE